MSDAQTAPTPDLSPEAFGAAVNDDDTPSIGVKEIVQTPEPEESAQVAEPQEEAQPDPYATAPEFWSAERKALWDKITDPEARKAVHEQERERIAATNKKIEEAANERKSAAERATQLEQERTQLADWWKDTGPKLAQAFQDKWAKVDWNDLAANNQAEYVRLTHERQADFALFQQTAERHKAEIAAANQRAERALVESKKAEHQKLSQKLPEYFGKPDVAQKTYDGIRDYLLEQGVPAERIVNIYEEPVVAIALKAMLYDKAKTEAAKATTQPQTTATQTPRRIAPGAATNSGQPTKSAAYRQALERLSNGEKNISREEAALLFA